MHQAASERYQKAVSTVAAVAAAAAAAARLPKSVRGTDRRRFLQAYYANVDAEDLATHEPAALAAAALSHLTFARQRRGRALVRVFNPTLAEHGYTSPHTVIEMVNDDMPFLVDSIGLALTRHALTLHFLTHPIFAVTRDRRRGLAQRRGARRRLPTGVIGSSRSSTSKWTGSSIRRHCSPCARRSSAACATCGWRAPIGSRC